MRYSTQVDIGQVKERQGGVNEDSVASLLFDETHRDRRRQSVGAFVLADGAGGHDAGDIASYLATTIIPEELSDLVVQLGRGGNPILKDLGLDSSELPNPPEEEAIRDAIRDAVAMADDRIQDLTDDAKTTVVVGVYARGSLHLGWVGDSRAYVINQSRESIEQVTRDHSVVEHYVEEESLSPTVARVHDDNNVITRAVGGSTVEVETNSVPIFGDDIILFASDGLIDAYDRSSQLYQKYLRERDEEEAIIAEIRESVVTDDEIAARVLESETLDVAAERLVNLAVNRGGSDNISTLLFTDPGQETMVQAGREDLVRTYERSEETERDLESGETIADGS
ncbi:PP2C family protein-serine/threonine phosphatase [Haloarchaeobius amylolyticus]|uniref:PP2C family protein-serine/threonine phosphatase n=1 Tax=Haloarchaeobius amylolyticus TaxID=1198296 RepID=UPI002271B56F|nr:protein phosphatase 2C domain-containing protein [Haloarchaeobius amylolyticus]